MLEVSFLIFLSFVVNENTTAYAFNTYWVFALSISHPFVTRLLIKFNQVILRMPTVYEQDLNFWVFYKFYIEYR